MTGMRTKHDLLRCNRRRSWNRSRDLDLIEKRWVVVALGGGGVGWWWRWVVVALGGGGVGCTEGVKETFDL